MTVLLGTKRARTRDQLLAAAQTLLLEHSAGSLGVRQIAAGAGLVHASFYNHYDSIDALIADLSDLILVAHGTRVGALRTGAATLTEAFARATRQTLRFVTLSPDYGRLLFDAGLPVDRFVSGLRATMAGDVMAGMANGEFRVADAELTVSMLSGAIMGVALDLHRGRLPEAAIEAATESLLRQLGVDPAEAARAAHAPMLFVPPPALPLRWLEMQA